LSHGEQEREVARDAFLLQHLQKVSSDRDRRVRGGTGSSKARCFDFVRNNDDGDGAGGSSDLSSLKPLPRGGKLDENAAARNSRRLVPAHAVKPKAYFGIEKRGHAKQTHRAIRARPLAMEASVLKERRAST
jgi:hypothetical protein